jgi:hypothetical protein
MFTKGVHSLKLESCGTVSDPEKSRMSLPAGQLELREKIFGTEEHRKKIMSRIFLVFNIKN